MKPFDVVIVTWVDAMIDGAAQHNSPAEAIDAYQPCIRKTVGYFVAKTEEVYVLATDDDRSVDYPRALGGIIYIPVSLVIDEQHIYESREDE